MDATFVPLSESPEALRHDYAVVIRLPVQWGDQDSFGHVNNTIYLRWFESARIAYMARLKLFTGQVGLSRPPIDAVSAGQHSAVHKLGLILASITCHFRKTVHFPDVVYVGARISSFGRTSMVMDHAVFSQTQEAMVADGTSTVVMFDYGVLKPIPVPEEVRQAVAELQSGGKQSST